MRTRLHVIAGEARGRVLDVPPGARPTAGRVREALFDSLGAMTGLHVLDLYAGSGAVAIEALSRGAAQALLVDRDRAAVEVSRANAERSGTAARARVVPRAVDALLAGPPPPEAPFDLVWCDPPYGTDPAEVGAVVHALAEPGWLDPDARIVVERAVQDGPSPPERDASGSVETDGVAVEVTWERKYGDTLVSVLRVHRRPGEGA